MRRLVAKFAVVAALASLPGPAASAHATVTVSSCGTCFSGGCPSPFTWDQICHMICQPTDLGWCSTGDTTRSCPMYFEGYLRSGIGNVS
jgi:hypothetical protein